jgi:hypothetical protein
MEGCVQDERLSSHRLQINRNFYVLSACDFIALNIHHRLALHSRQALSDGAVLRRLLQQDVLAAQPIHAILFHRRHTHIVVLLNHDEDCASVIAMPSVIGICPKS